MKNNKGFTLIELLAVILILGIIALIAIPTVTSVVNQSRKGAFENTVKNIADVVERTCTSEMLEGKAITTKYTFNTNGVEPALDIKGDLPSSGTINVNDKCEVKINVNNNGMIAFKGFDDDVSTIVTQNEKGFTYEPAESGETYKGILYINPSNLKEKCSKDNYVGTTKTTTGCLKFYVYRDNGDGTFSAILDHNTTVETVLSSYYSTQYNSEDGQTYTNQTYDLGREKLLNDTSTWEAIPTIDRKYVGNQVYNKSSIDYTGMHARLLTLGEIRELIFGDNIDVGVIRDMNIYLTSDGNRPSSKIISPFYWLFDNLAWCNQTSTSCKTPDDNTYDGRETIAYWLATPDNSMNTVSNLRYTGYISTDGENSAYNVGIRPVIEFPKYWID